MDAIPCRDDETVSDAVIQRQISGQAPSAQGRRFPYGPPGFPPNPFIPPPFGPGAGGAPFYHHHHIPRPPFYNPFVPPPPPLRPPPPPPLQPQPPHLMNKLQGPGEEKPIEIDSSVHHPPPPVQPPRAQARLGSMMEPPPPPPNGAQNWDGDEDFLDDFHRKFGQSK